MKPRGWTQAGQSPTVGTCHSARGHHHHHHQAGQRTRYGRPSSKTGERNTTKTAEGSSRATTLGEQAEASLQSSEEFEFSGPTSWNAWGLRGRPRAGRLRPNQPAVSQATAPHNQRRILDPVGAKERRHSQHVQHTSSMAQRPRTSPPRPRPTAAPPSAHITARSRRAEEEPPRSRRGLHGGPRRLYLPKQSHLE